MPWGERTRSSAAWVLQYVWLRAAIRRRYVMLVFCCGPLSEQVLEIVLQNRFKIVVGIKFVDVANALQIHDHASISLPLRE